MSSEKHIVIVPLGEGQPFTILCQNCGCKVAADVPIEISFMAKLIDLFASYHRKCTPKNGDKK